MQTKVDTAFALTRIILLTLAMIMMFMIVTKQYQKPNGRNKLLSKLEDPGNDFILEKIRFSTTKLPITTYEMGPTSPGMIY